MSINKESVFPLDDSLCKHCDNRLSRIVIPLDYEFYGINIEDFDLDEGESLEVEQHTCLELGQDLDAVVIACNKYVNSADSQGLINNFVF